MRDFERDDGGRSPSAVGVFLLVAFGAAFAGGIWVGQRRAESRRASGDDPLGTLDGTDPGTTEPLVFHEALRLPSPPSNEMNAPIVTRPAHTASPVVGAALLPEPDPIDPVSRNDAPALRPELPAPSEPVPPGEDGIFTLHVASYESEADATHFEEEIRRKGHRAFVVRTTVEGRGVVYRVRVGPFHTLAEAQRYRLDFEAQTSLPTFIVRRELEEAPPAPRSPRRIPTST
jgi:hypothetical protein